MRFSIATIIFFMCALWASKMLKCHQVCPTPVPAKYAQIKPGNIRAAYFANWDVYKNDYQVEDIEPIASKLTHIMYAFVKPNAQTGQCELHDVWADIGANKQYQKKVSGNFGKLLELKKNFPHLKVLLSIGGGTYSKNFSEIIEKGLLDTFVDSCMAILDRYEYQYVHDKTEQQESVVFEYPTLFDGLDIDWEWLNHVVPEQDAQSYLSLVTKLRKRLNSRAKKVGCKQLLTCALQVHPNVHKGLDLFKVAAQIDWFNVMAYNFSSMVSQTVGFNAPICNPWSHFSIDSMIDRLMNQGVSPAKMVLGLPLYGHVFDQTSGKIGAEFVRTDITTSLSYDSIYEKYVTNAGCEYKWHEKSKVPYLYCKKDKIFVSFDDDRSLRKKIEFAKNQRLKGVVLWKLSGDDSEHGLIQNLF